MADRFENHLIIGSDQIALFEQTRLGKPGGHAEAVDQLMAISGKTVEFLTSVCLFDSASGKKLTDVDRTVVRFRKLSRQQLESYAAKDRPYDCAGGFKSESLGIALIENLETGDPHALIGLPLIKLVGLLAKFGVEIF